MSKYKEILNEMHDIPNKEKKENHEVTVSHSVSPKIKKSPFYNNLSPLEKYNVDKYVDKKVNLYEGVIGFNKVDSLTNGVEIPEKYLVERVIYDRSSKKIKMSPRMMEMIKRQVKGMNGYKLSRVYETKSSYRMVFESENDGHFEVSIKEIK